MSSTFDREERKARYISNHDGDSVTMLLNQGFYQTFQINLRLASVWAPETKDFGGIDCKYFVQEWFMRYMVKTPYRWPFVVYTYTTSVDTPIKTFDRFIGDIVARHDGASLNSDIMRYIVEHDYLGGTGAPVRTDPVA